MGIFDGILICTDLDGTILKKDKSISEENLKAIEYFKERGGIFTFVTGRMPYYICDAGELIKANAPFGCINGGGLYDYEKKRYIWTKGVSEDVLELVEYVDNMLPDVGIQVCTFDKLYFCKQNRTMENFRKITKVENLVCHYREVKEPIAKILFGSESNDEILRLKELLDNHPLADQFDFIRSERSLYEILPKGIGKGMSIKKLCEILDLDINKTIAVGDYDNDISMFNAAKIGIAVSNASEAAKKAADYTTVSNEEDAIAHIIYDVEKGKYGLLKK